jgi:hypothetical protein
MRFDEVVYELVFVSYYFAGHFVGQGRLPHTPDGECDADHRWFTYNDMDEGRAVWTRDGNYDPDFWNGREHIATYVRSDIFAGDDHEGCYMTYALGTMKVNDDDSPSHRAFRIGSLDFMLKSRDRSTKGTMSTRTKENMIDMT